MARAVLRGFVVLGLASAASCGGTERGPEAPRSAIAAKDVREAAELRVRAAELATEGRIARAARALARANRLAATGAEASRALELDLAVALGRQSDALSIAAEIEASPAATEAAKTAARRARAATWPSRDGLGLAREGLAMKTSGRLADARRLFDRAVDSLEEKTQHPLRLSPLPTAPVERVRWSPDGARISVARGTGAEILDGETGARIFTMGGHVEAVTDAPFHPQKPVLATCGWDGVVNLWDLDTATLLRSFDHEKLEDATFAYYVCDFSRDGKFLAAGAADGILKVWDTETGALVHTSKDHKARVRALAFSPDGTSLVTAAEGGVILRHVGSWQVRARDAIEDTLTTLSFDPEHAVLFAGGSTIHTLDAKTLKAGASVSAHAALTGLVALRGGAVVAATAAGARELTSGRALRAGALAVAGPIDVRADGRRLATVTEDKKNVIVLELPELPRSTEVRLEWPRIDGPRAVSIVGNARWRHAAPHERPLARVGFSPRGQAIAAVSQGTLYAWRLDGQPIRKNERFAVVGAGVQDECDYAFSPDGESIVSVGGTKEERATVHLHRLDGDEKGSARMTMESGASAQSVAFAPDGALVAALWGTKTVTNVTLFNPATHERTGAVVADGAATQTLNCVGFGAGHTVHWQEDTKTVVYDFVARTRADFPPGAKLAFAGPLLAVGNRSAIDLWDTTTQRHLRVIDLPAWLSGLAFGPGGVLAASAGGKTLVWPLPSESRPYETGVAGSKVDTLAFHPGGKTFATSGDGEIRVWSLSDRSIRARIHLGEKDLFVVAPTGHVEASLETARERLGCAIGAVAVPLELCEDRFFEPYLLEKIVHGDDSYLEGWSR